MPGEEGGEEGAAGAGPAQLDHLRAGRARRQAAATWLQCKSRRALSLAVQPGSSRDTGRGDRICLSSPERRPLSREAGGTSPFETLPLAAAPRRPVSRTRPVEPVQRINWTIFACLSAGDSSRYLGDHVAGRRGHVTRATEPVRRSGRSRGRVTPPRAAMCVSGDRADGVLLLR